MDIRTKQKEYRKKCLEIVEKVLTDEVIEEKEFLDKCLYISRNDYNDICIERSLTDLCGYALCSHRLSAKSQPKFKPKQKYKIDSKNNRIFEIEERKQFCSNLCYNSSNYLREQISEEPIYMRPKSAVSGDHKPIHLYSNRSGGQLGEEVVFDQQLIDGFKSKSKDKNVLLKRKDVISFPYIKEEYLDQLKDQMNNLSVSERNAPEEASNEPQEASNEPQDCTQKSVQVLTECPKSDQSKSKANPNPKPIDLSKSKLECVERVIKEWITSSTHEFLFGVKKDINYEMIRQMDESVDFEEEEKRKKLSDMRFNYMKISARLDVEEKKDQLIDDILLGKAKNGKSAEEYANEDRVSVYNDDFEGIFDAFKSAKVFNLRNRKVQFKQKDSSVAPIDSVEPTEPSDHWFVPPTDSQFIRNKRLEIVLANVENALNVWFESKYLTDLRPTVKDLIKTFRLTAKNVAQNEDSLLVSLFLIRMLVIGKKGDNLDQLFDTKPISECLVNFGLKVCEIDQKICSYFQI